jgi:hypothetical protein
MSFTLSLSDVALPETVQRSPIRPLGAVSNFVVEEMPYALRESDYSLTTKMAEDLAVAGCDALKLHPPQSQQESALAHLDASMLYEFSTKVPCVDVTRNALFALLKETASVSSGVRGLTYEGLIHANPLHTDPRTFLHGPDGASETLFYAVHATIERVISQAVCSLHKALEAGSPENIAQCAQQVVLPAIDQTRTHMEALMRELPEHAFASLRPFFSPAAERGIKGPSGLYSAGIFCLDAYIAGNLPPMKRFQDYKFAELSYYPGSQALEGFTGRHDMQKASEMANRGITLQALGLSKVTRELASSILGMRKVHFGLAHKFIIKNLGVSTGSAGTDIRKFLQMPMDIYRSLAGMPMTISFPSHPDHESRQ